MEAAAQGVTGVVGAGVAVVAGQDGDPRADAAHAEVVGGARVPVVAGDRGGLVEATPGHGLAAVEGAGVLVVAEVVRAGADPLRADVVHGAGRAVVAGGLVERVGAPVEAVAAIVGAGIAVVAVEEGPRRAGPLEADLVRGAGVVILAGLAVVDGDEDAGLGHAGRALAVGELLVRVQALVVVLAAGLHVGQRIGDAVGVDVRGRDLVGEDVQGLGVRRVDPRVAAALVLEGVADLEAVEVELRRRRVTPTAGGREREEDGP